LREYPYYQEHRIDIQIPSPALKNISLETEAIHTVLGLNVFVQIDNKKI
jgi:hypothetical protein